MKIMVFYNEGHLNLQKLLESLLKWYVCVESLTLVDFTRFCNIISARNFVIDNISDYDLIVMATENRNHRTWLRKVANCPTQQFIQYSTIRQKLNNLCFRKPVRFYINGKLYFDIPPVNSFKIKFI